MSDNEATKLLPLLNALFEGRRRTLGMVEAAIENFSSVETEITKLNRKMNGLQDSNMRQFGTLQELAVRQHGETTGRLDAVSVRIEDMERQLDERARDVKRTQIDLTGQYNDILTALQNASQALRISEETSIRLHDLENRMSPPS